MQYKKQKLEPDMEQQIASKMGNKYHKAAYCPTAYLNYMQSTSCEMLSWMHTSWIKIAGRNINNLRYADDITLMTKSKRN